MNGYYGGANWLTYLNMIFGVIGISFAFRGDLTITVICLIMAGISDMFDGTVAKRFERSEEEKSYGVQIDSLADVISFGVLPGVIGISLGMERFPLIIVVVLYVLAALIRLAYFNVTELAFLEKGESRVFYEGLPVTSVAAIIPFGYLMNLCLEFPSQPAYSILLGVISIGFLSKFKIYKLKLRTMIVLGTISIPVIIGLVIKIVRLR